MYPTVNWQKQTLFLYCVCLCVCICLSLHTLAFGVHMFCMWINTYVPIYLYCMYIVMWYVLVCVWGGPTQSAICVSTKHKAVCSKLIGPERVNTLPREPHTHDPAGLSAPLNMTIHPLGGMCVCFPFLDVLMCTCMNLCLRKCLFLCALIAHIHSKHVLPCCECVCASPQSMCKHVYADD